MAKTKKGSGEPNHVDKKDFWDKIAEDVSAGYGAAEVRKVSAQEELLNEDQEPDDQKRGDS